MKSHHQYSYAAVLQFSTTVLLGLISFALCFAAEFKRSKKDDLRLNGKLCHLPKSQGFELGIAALVLLFIAQIIGNLFTCQKFRSRKHHHHEGSPKTKFPKITIISLILSWSSFVVAAILIGAASSMNLSQEFGEGWLDGECYIVKDGVFVGAAVVILVAVGSTLSSAAMVRNKVQGEQGRKVYAQAESPSN